ncbi:hypothetical protein LTV02_13075 [Nocardia yamanashiensis]|uniref:hypothetical protein n=1 Tax=Nocardia yamanashiensis TaxID=209247 RepID=UPI001E44B141|nr:hypothetical protein [Nocardia yamanashiensis]UGT44261.1 hypothetical protein LTV02_13075 [Nocardia yamanashiensis]
MAVSRLSDEEIAGMSDEERRALIARLRLPPERVLPRPGLVTWNRRIRLTLMVGGSIALIPWIVFLAMTLPMEYHARNWSITWVGFDILLVLMMATTAYVGWRRWAILPLPACGTGLLLLVDAWFDIMTADSRDMWVSVGTALIGEIPLAVLLISGALMLFRFLVLVHPLYDPAVSAWKARLPF